MKKKKKTKNDVNIPKSETFKITKIHMNFEQYHNRVRTTIFGLGGKHGREKIYF